MKETKQKEYIQSLIEESVSREEQIIRIQELYNICKEHFTERDFTELSLLAVRFALPWVRRHLWNAGCYSHDNEDTVMQEVRIAIWKTIVDAGNAGHEIDRFAYYILSICKNKTFDVIRLEMRERASKLIWKLFVSAGTTLSLSPAPVMYGPYSGKYGAKTTTSSPGSVTALTAWAIAPAAPVVRDTGYESCFRKMGF